MESQLLRAIQFALTAYGDARDFTGEPAILHPLAVMARVRGETARTVAVLHDILEDTVLDFSELREQFGEEVADAVQILSRNRYPGLTYMEYIRQIKGVGGVAMEVKRADLLCNMTRGPYGTLQERYRKALKVLGLPPEFWSGNLQP